MLNSDSKNDYPLNKAPDCRERNKENTEGAGVKNRAVPLRLIEDIKEAIEVGSLCKQQLTVASIVGDVAQHSDKTHDQRLHHYRDALSDSFIVNWLKIGFSKTI